MTPPFRRIGDSEAPLRAVAGVAALHSAEFSQEVSPALHAHDLRRAQNCAGLCRDEIATRRDRVSDCRCTSRRLTGSGAEPLLPDTRQPCQVGGSARLADALAGLSPPGVQHDRGRVGAEPAAVRLSPQHTVGLPVRPVIVAGAVDGPASLDLIPSVVGVCPVVKVRRPPAWRVVALVQHESASGDISHQDAIGDSVDKLSSAIHADATVAPRRSRARPHPTPWPHVRPLDDALDNSRRVHSTPDRSIARVCRVY